jgi:hypothetical protein
MERCIRHEWREDPYTYRLDDITEPDDGLFLIADYVKKIKKAPLD